MPKRGYCLFDINNDERIALLMPSIDQLKKAQWYDDVSLATIAASPDNYPNGLASQRVS